MVWGMTDTDAAIVTGLDDLVQALADLANLDDTDRVTAARRLAVSMPQQLAALADAWTWELTRTRTQLDTARGLGVSRSQVERAITRHNGRQRNAALTRSRGEQGKL